VSVDPAVVAIRECLLESLSILVGKRLVVEGGALQSPKHGIIDTEPEKLQKPSCRLELGLDSGSASRSSYRCSLAVIPSF
jgi:hypothetical protein